jgi:pimeloyl-ACP methyl ester carboxylesterase
MNAALQPRRLSHKIFRSLAGLALLGLLVIAVVLLSLRLEHEISVTLPSPTGPFAVGRVIYDWAGDARPSLPSPEQPIARPTKRELLVWVWYPAQANPETSQSPTAEDYLPPAMRAAIEEKRGPLISKFFTRNLSKVHAHGIPNSEVSNQLRSYPVVFLRAGASAEVWNYTTLAEDLASHGYVVVGLDAPYRTNVVAFPDGRVIRRLPWNNPEICLELPAPQQSRCAEPILAAWSSDLSFALDHLEQLNASDPSGKFTGRMDLARVGVYGHSFGGATALQFCHDDPRCKAGIDLDGAPQGNVIQSGVDRPFLFLLSDHSREPAAEVRQIKANLQSIYDRLPPNGRLYLAIRGANHFLFSDDGALLKSQIVEGAFRQLGILGIDGPRQLAITTYCVRTFFDAYLKQTNVPLSPPQIQSTLYPEIEFLE